MANYDTVDSGYPTSPLSKFVGGLETGWHNMQDRYKQAMELRQLQQQYDWGEEAKKNIKGQQDDKPAKTATLPAGDTNNPSGGGSATGGTGSGSSGGGGGGGGDWGPAATAVTNYFKSIGWSDAAIAGAMGNGLGEGGFGAPWKQSSVVDKNGNREQSWGHWQFHRGGELDGYEDWLTKNNLDPKDPTVLQDSVNQAKYFAKRMNEINPNFGKLTDANAAGDQVLQGFEKPRNAASGSRNNLVATAQKYLANPPQTAAAPEQPGDTTGSIPDVPHYGADLQPAAAPTSAIGASVQAAPAPAPTQTASAAPIPSGQEQYRGGLGPNVKFNSQGVPYNPAMVAGGSQGATPSGVRIPARPSAAAAAPAPADDGTGNQSYNAPPPGYTRVASMEPHPTNPWGPSQVAIGGVAQQRFPVDQQSVVGGQQYAQAPTSAPPQPQQPPPQQPSAWQGQGLPTVQAGNQQFALVPINSGLFGSTG
jgi:hypothetical protein